jgi:lipopolysaccharide biosynthesis regulator YciM
LTLVNYFNLGLLCRKKGQLDRALRIFKELISKLENHLEQNDIIVSEKTEHILMLSRINVVKIAQELGKNSEASSVAKRLLKDDSLIPLDEKTQMKLSVVSKSPSGSGGIFLPFEY